jgi:membrane-associated phospholipid phosphatase
MSRIFKKLSIILGFFIFSLNLNAQYVYRYRAFLDPAFAIGNGIVFTGSLLAQKHVTPLEDKVILALNKQDVNQFDRYACSQWNPKVAKASDVLALGSGLMYSYFLFNPDYRKESVNIAGVAFQSLLLSQSLSNALKLGLRNRPYLYNQEVNMEEKRKVDARMSFFSAHTSTVSSLCYSFALAHNTYFPNKRHTGIWIGAITIPAIEGFLRVKAGKHYPSDVITGYLVGLGSSFIMHYLHKQKQ